MSDIYNILKVLRPNNNWSTTNNTFTWEDDIALKPTDDEIEAKRIELENEVPMKQLREERNIKLLETDKYTSIPDWPHASEEVKQAWVTYRQALRDLPATVVEQNVVLDPDLTNVTWPTPPS